MGYSELHDAILLARFLQWIFVAYFFVTYFTCKYLTQKETIALLLWVEIVINFPYIEALINREIEPYVSNVIFFVLLMNISIGGIGTLLLMKFVKKKGA